MDNLDEFLESILGLEYPKNKLNLFIHNNVPSHSSTVDKFIETHGSSYEKIEQHKTNETNGPYDRLKLSDLMK